MSNLQQPSGPRDEASKVYNSFFQDIDNGFIGVDERTPPYQLASGWVASARNKRFRQGRATDRGGIALCRWMKGDGTQPFAQIFGGALYTNPTETDEWILMAADGGVWKTRESNVATPVPLPPFVVLTKDSFDMFVQCMNVMILLRGPYLPALTMPNLDAGFQMIVQTLAGIEAGTTPIPNSSFGAYILNRLGLVQGKDFMAMSDIGDYTSYQEVTETFQINQGDSDVLVGFAMMNNGTIICLKTRSVYNILNAVGDLATNATGPFLITREYGCEAVRTIVQRGANVYWLAQGHVVQSVATTQLNQQQATTTSLSWTLPLTTARINGSYVGGACAEIWDSKLYLAVPLDDATFHGLFVPSNTIVVPDMVTFTVTPGQSYAWTPEGTLGEIIFDGMGNELTTAGVITPMAGTLTVQGTFGVDYTGTLQSVIVGANTGVLVYDFINSAWCGSDEAEGVICPVQFLRKIINGQEQLLALCADGWIRMWEVGFEDEIVAPIASPYCDIVISGQPPISPAVAQIVIGPSGKGQVTINAQNAITNGPNNPPALWGCGDPASTAVNLWSDGTYGLDPALVNTWNTGSTWTAEQITGGVRIIPAPGNAMPPITVDIFEVGNLPLGNVGWAMFDLFEGNVIQTQPIESQLTSRAFTCLDKDGKRYVDLLTIAATWNPSYVISTSVNGAYRTTQYLPPPTSGLSGITKDRTQYDISGQPAFDVSNVNNDWAAPERLDYTAGLDDLSPGQAAMNLQGGINLDQAQDTIERIAVDERGYWMQVQFVNNTGTHEVKAILMEILKGDRTVGAGV